MSKKPLLIGVTGGIGSGKSTICKVYESLGVPVYYADERAKHLTKTDITLKKSIIKRFGKEAYKGNSLNKAYMAAKVFSNKNLLKDLNELIHPRVALDYEEWVDKNSEKPYLLKEAALIFETKGNEILDKVIMVSADEETRIQRVLNRDKHRNSSDIHKIINNQLPENTKKSLSDFIIENDHQVLVIPQILTIHRKLIQLSNNQVA